MTIQVRPMFLRKSKIMRTQSVNQIPLSQFNEKNNNSLSSPPVHYSYYTPQVNRSIRKRQNDRQSTRNNVRFCNSQYILNYEFDNFDGIIHSIYAHKNNHNNNNINNNNCGFLDDCENEQMLQKFSNYRLHRKDHRNRDSYKHHNSPYISRKFREHRRSNVYDYETSSFELNSINEGYLNEI